MSDRDNFSQLFNGGGNKAVSTTSEPSHLTQNYDAPSMGDEFNEIEDTNINAATAATTTDEVIVWDNDGREEATNSEELVVDWDDTHSKSHTTSSNTLPQSTATATANSIPTSNYTPTTSTSTAAGTETIQHLKSFGSSIFGSTISKIKPLKEKVREVNISQKLAAATDNIDKIQDRIESRFNERQADKALAAQLDSMNAEIANEQSKKEAEREQNELEQEIKSRFGSADSDNHKSDEQVGECDDEHIYLQVDTTSYKQGWKYDALVKFTSSAPTGSYEEFIEFLLMGGWRSSESTDNAEIEEECNQLMYQNYYAESSEYRRLWNANLDKSRAYVPEVPRSSTDDSSPNNRQRTHSEDERIRNFHVDKQKIKQGLGTAVSAISSVSSLALKPLRDLQLAEKLNAMNIDAEEEQARREIEQYNRIQQDKKDLEEMMAIKKEAEERCMNDTKDHLLAFIKDNPNAKYHQWIEAFHPENAHDGMLLEGMGKTIDHRFYVEESDHRRLWNAHLYTYLDPGTKARDFVPARAKQMDESGEMVKAEDILSGTIGRELPQQHFDDNGKLDADLMAFD